MTAAIRAGLCLALTLALAGCATTGPATPGDPLERMNRGTYRFNAAIDRAVLKPVATGYRNGVPRVVRTGIGNVLSNLAFPTTIINDLLQLKLKDAAIDLGRFAINSTLGLGGLLDPASHFGIPRNNEDFGQTLGRWGVPAGPYVVLPLFGPSTLRDAPSMLVDAQTDLRVQLDLETEEKVALGVLTVVDRRAGTAFRRSVDRSGLRPLCVRAQRLAAAPRVPGAGRRGARRSAAGRTRERTRSFWRIRRISRRRTPWPAAAPKRR